MCLKRGVLKVYTAIPNVFEIHTSLCKKVLFEKNCVQIFEEMCLKRGMLKLYTAIPNIFEMLIFLYVCEVITDQSILLKFLMIV